MDNTIKIALIDDHVLLRDALATIINQFERCQVMLVARTGKELIDSIRSENLPDLVLLDINMPEIDGYETAEWLRKRYPNVYILILTMYDSELALIRLLQLGVRGFLKKDIHPSELKNAILTTMASGYYYSGQTSSKLAALLKTGDTKASLVNKVTLPANELRFLELASTEMTYKEIAQAMEISPRTIDNYRDSLFEKLDVKSRVGLVLYAIRSGVVRLDID
ncbi:MAG: response regulator transcription factor [Puia sp.]|nr:response regulator transcription factor [Puia sp.]